MTQEFYRLKLMQYNSITTPTLNYTAMMPSDIYSDYITLPDLYIP